MDCTDDFVMVAEEAADTPMLHASDSQEPQEPREPPRLALSVESQYRRVVVHHTQSHPHPHPHPRTGSHSDSDSGSAPGLASQPAAPITPIAAPASSCTELVVDVTIKAPPAAEAGFAADAAAAESRPGVDLVLVLDRSISMQGEKLELCKQTAEMVVDALSSRDSLALVSYSTAVALNMPLRVMDAAGKREARAALATVRPDGRHLKFQAT